MPQSPERLWEMYEEWHKQKPDERLLPYNNDIHMIAPMVIHLGEVSLDPLDGLPFDNGKIKHNYTCKHFDKETRNCGIYEHRPLMCREYPNGYRCRYKGCTAVTPIPVEVELSKKLEAVGEELAGESMHESKMEAE